MATGTTVFSRVTVVAPRTRIDVALPADVSVADLLPMLLEMAKETTTDGGARHGGWCLAKLGDAPLDPSRTLGSLGVVDGDMLQLRKRSENPPPPLYDDVVDAIAESAPDSFRPWTKETAHRIGHIAGALALLLGAVAVLLAGPVGGVAGNLAPAVTAGAAAVVFVALGAVLAKGYQAPTTGVLVAAAGGLPMAFVSGLYIVPGEPGRASLLLACALVLIVASASIMLIGAGVTTFVAAGTAALLGVGAFTVATLVAHPAPGIGAGAVAVALAALSVLPRLTIQLARLPLPNVPGSAEDLKEDTGFPDYRSIERRAGLAHEYMTGMIIGCGVAAAVGAIVSAGSPKVWGVLLGVVATLVLLLRARTYANGSQAVALLATGMLSAAGILVGWLMQADGFERLLWVFGALVLLAAAAMVLGVVFPDQRFSPPLRRTVEVFEAIFIAVVLPLALAVMDLYATLRQVSFG
ncbi:type VII secretion integral membrane protein EccD [Actinokineospora bangkokensis]|uniref:Type VII secretion integral membrane protein EccD n=1 Tax=Actinokineospora bangkokensis TaxID=1193682 RepID=A0A1Q9LEZ7_9PSEU|nr:type VII secretion integral membrane protein EccD [Actinokineospora bangkokensis]OLR90606.1 type VII secretion integral membrane protein EccD [Actinokineospora bangkokensis]